jgi:hypothetical protein
LVQKLSDSLLAATLYQGNIDRKYKPWNIVSPQRYIHYSIIVFEIKDTTDTSKTASYLETDIEGWLRMKLNINFSIVNFPFIHSNIPAAP